jgi:hypothetical protein
MKKKTFNVELRKLNVEYWTLATAEPGPGEGGLNVER